MLIISGQISLILKTRAVVRAKRGQHDQAVKDLDEVMVEWCIGERRRTAYGSKHQSTTLLLHSTVLHFLSLLIVCTQILRLMP